MRIIPPFMYTACLRALATLSEEDIDGVHVHHADEEGDPFAVDLAARLGGYVTGLDSDYAILNASGYKGYIPLDELVWEWAAAPVADDAETPTNEDDGWFEPVKKGKKRNVQPQVTSARVIGYGLLPSELDIASLSVPAELSLSAIVYHPTQLATNLKLAPNLLPLLGALIGNDYTQGTVVASRDFQSLFFERQMSLSQRIPHVASVLREVTAIPPPSARNKQKSPQSGLGAIEAAVDKLLNRNIHLIGAGERERIVNVVVEATLQYAITTSEGLNPSRFCPLHECDACPLVHALTDGTEEEDVMQAEIRRRYVGAYRAGQLSPRLLDAVRSNTIWPRIFLESPDFEATARTFGKPLREWTYAIMDEAVGLPETTEDIPASDVDSDDELIDVVEEDTDSDGNGGLVMEKPPVEDALISALAPKLQRLFERRAFHSGVTSPTGITSPGSPTRPGSANDFSTTLSMSQLSSLLRGAKKVTEYLRRGTRVADEDVVVRSFSALQETYSWSPEWYGSRNATPDIPLVLRDESERLQVFLRILGSDNSLCMQLPYNQVAAVLAVRHVVKTLSTRASQKSGNKEYEKERWTKKEARALLFSFDWKPPVDGEDSSQTIADPATLADPIVENRNVQLVAQFYSALEAIDHLAQALLLAARVPNPISCFSGKRCHLKLTSTSATSNAESSDIWNACVEGLELDFAAERTKKVKKDKTAPSSPAMSKSPSLRSGMSSNSSHSTVSMYSVLSGMSIT
jgi:hypothetical protein